MNNTPPPPHPPLIRKSDRFDEVAKIPFTILKTKAMLPIFISEIQILNS